MANLPAFKQQQYEFAAYIRDPENTPVPAGIEPRRMAIYGELFFNNIEEFISTTYPVLKEITDESCWQDMLRDYFKNHLSTTPLFPELPREFLKYLETERENKDDPPFLYELAHYEWVELALEVSDRDNEINWSEIDTTADLLDAEPALSPLAWPLSYQYPVHLINSEFQPHQPAEQPVHLMVYRDNDDEVHFMELNPVTALLLHLIQQENSLTTREILLQIAEQLHHPDPEVVIRGGMEIMNDLKARNVILGVNKR